MVVSYRCPSRSLVFFLFLLGSSARLEPLRPASWSSDQLRRLPRPPKYHEPGQFLQVIKYKVGQKPECRITYFCTYDLYSPRAQPPPTCPRNGYARIQNIMHRAV
jgi:hypothetical protein